jgi:hypothetical protein
VPSRGRDTGASNLSPFYFSVLIDLRRRWGERDHDFAALSRLMRL